MSTEAHCPNCGCAFELSAEDVAAIVAASKPEAPESPGPRASRFAFLPEVVLIDGEKFVRVAPAESQQKPNVRG